ncbi:UNVERIFIED_CONTAM: hypothetical protein GTU68_059183 [Idotea baltica]|nr:hypothetical protein [Idotea baltica]
MERSGTAGKTYADGHFAEFGRLV